MCDSNLDNSPVLTDNDRALVHKIEAAAVKQWGEDYAISIRRWADGTATIYAEHIVGLTPDGHRKKERLMPDEEGNFGLDVVVETRSETVESEVIEHPVEGVNPSNKK